MRPVDPWANPLQMFLDSVARYRGLPAEVLVLPSHGTPFRGAHERVAALEAHHVARLTDLEQACTRAPQTGATALEVLFRRKLGRSQVFFAMGEAIAPTCTVSTMRSACPPRSRRGWRGALCRLRKEPQCNRR